MSNSCHDLNEANISEDIAGKKILLVGNPNVGKSVFFSNYTKINAVSSNFAGTTVSYLKGTLDFGEEKYTLIDVPGIFSLNGKTVADEVALKFVHSNPQAIIFILDATNLTRSVELALELKEFDIPTVYALNFLDVAKGKGNPKHRVFHQRHSRPAARSYRDHQAGQHSRRNRAHKLP